MRRTGLEDARTMVDVMVERRLKPREAIALIQALAFVGIAEALADGAKALERMGAAQASIAEMDRRRTMPGGKS